MRLRPEITLLPAKSKPISAIKNVLDLGIAGTVCSIEAV